MQLRVQGGVYVEVFPCITVDLRVDCPRNGVPQGEKERVKEGGADIFLTRDGRGGDGVSGWREGADVWARENFGKRKIRKTKES